MLPSQYPRQYHVGNGSTTSFAYAFRVFEASDLRVYFGAVEQTSGFTVQGIGEVNGGAVVFSSAPAAALLIIFERSVPASRDTDFQVGGDFIPAAVNTQLDRILALIQQIEAQLARTPRLAVESTETSIDPFPIGDAGKALVWESTTKLVNSDQTIGDVFTAAENAADAASRAASDAAAAATILNQIAVSAAIDPVVFLLVAGVQSYDLGADWPDLETDPDRYRVVIGGSLQLASDKFSITSVIRPGKTITLIPDVVTFPTPDDLPGGQEMRVEIQAIGIYAYRDESVLENHLADDAVSTRTIQDGAVTGTKLASSLDLSGGKVAVGTLPQAALAGVLTAGTYPPGLWSLTAGGTISSIVAAGSYALGTMDIVAGGNSSTITWSASEVSPAFVAHICGALQTSGPQALSLRVGTEDGEVTSGYYGRTYTAGITAPTTTVEAQMLLRGYGVTSHAVTYLDISIQSVKVATNQYVTTIKADLVMLDTTSTWGIGMAVIYTDKPITSVRITSGAGTFYQNSTLYMTRSR